MLVPGSGLPGALAEPSLRGIPMERGRPTPRLEDAAGPASAVAKFALFTALFCSDSFAGSLCWVRLLLPGQVPTRLPGAHPTSPPASPMTASRVPTLQTHHLALACESRPVRRPLPHIQLRGFQMPQLFAGSRAVPYRSCPSCSLRPGASNLNARSGVLSTPSPRPSPHLASCRGRSHACLIRPKPRGVCSF